MKYNIPGLHGGISQQSPLLRMPNQHEDVLNVTCDVVDGLRFPRPGTDFVYTRPTEAVLGTIRTTDGKFWAIVRSDFGGGDNILAVDMATGNEGTGGADVSTIDYLKDGADLRLVPLLDTVFLLNRNKTVEVNQVASGITTAPVGLVYIEQAYETLNVNITFLLKTTVQPSVSYPIAGTTLNYHSRGYTVPAGTVDAGVVASHLAANLNDYMDVSQSGGLVRFTPAGQKVTNGGNTYTCILTHTADASNEPGGVGSWATYWTLYSASAPAEITAWGTGVKYYSLADILLMKPELRITYDPLVSQHPAKVYSGLLVENPLSTATPKVSYYVTTASSYEELPPFIPSGWAPNIVFQLSDGYYTKFDVDTSTYIECVAPGQIYKMDNLTMPYKMEYASGVWSITTGDWGDYPRTVGDSESAPLPDFVGRTLNDMFYYRGRLCFLSDNYVCMSRVNAPYDFFPQTATEVLDDDPICVFPSSLDYHELFWAKPFSKQLMLFGARKQYVLHSGFEALTPKTVAIDEATAMHLLPEIEPVIMESSMLLASDNGDYMGITEYKLSQQEISTDGMELTESVARLIPAAYDRITYVPGANVALVYKSGESTVYCYKFHRQMDGQLTQVAWTRWELPYDILNIILFESDKVYFVLSVDDDTSACYSMNLSEGYEAVPMDNRVYGVATADYSSGTGRTAVIDTDTYKLWDGLSHPEPGESKNVCYGIPIEASVTLSPLVLRDQKGLPRADIAATIQNLQVDWVGGQATVEIEGQGLPNRRHTLTPIEYNSESCDAGASYLEPRPSRVLVMYPAARTTISLVHTGTRCTRVNNIVYNLDVIKDWG